MLLQQNPQSVSSLLLLFTAGGWLYVAFAIATTIWGLVNLLRRSGATAIYSQMLVSVIPSLIAVFAIYSTYSDFRLIASSQQTPKPASIAEVCTRGMAHGLWGILATLVPLMLGLFTAWRVHRAVVKGAMTTV